MIQSYFSTSRTTRLKFESGNDIKFYGASLAWCNESSMHTIPRYSNSLSSISGDPLRVCICDSKNKPLCQNLSHAHSFTPGEKITLLVVVVGGDWGATPGAVHAYYPSSSAKILRTEYHQWIIKAQCTPVNYTVYSNQSVQLILSAHSYTKGSFPDFCDYNRPHNFTKKACEFSSPLYVNLTVLPCPPGFSLQRDPRAPGCECYPMLPSNGVECTL
jgi:hypothetical protein